MSVNWCSPFLVFLLFALALVSLYFCLYYKYKSRFSLSNTKSIQDQSLIWLGVFAIIVLFNFSAQSVCTMAMSSHTQRSLADATSVLSAYGVHFEKLSQLSKLDKLDQLSSLEELKSVETVIANGISNFDTRLASWEKHVDLKTRSLLSELGKLEKLNRLEELSRLSNLSNLKSLEKLSLVLGKDNTDQFTKFGVTGSDEEIEFPIGYPRDEKCMCPGGRNCVFYTESNRDSINRILKNIDDTVVAAFVVGGHDYRQGKPNQNYALAERRANCVVEQLPRGNSVSYIAIARTNKYERNEITTKEQIQSDRTASVMLVRKQK